jgi:hypothetical protein
VSYSNKQWSFLKDLSLLITFIAKSGWKATGGDLERSYAEQDRKYGAGLSKSKGGESRHNYKMAIDLNLWNADGIYMPYIERDFGREAHDEMLAEIVEYWESLNHKNRAGLNFKTFRDPYHFERGD